MESYGCHNCKYINIFESEEPCKSSSYLNGNANVSSCDKWELNPECSTTPDLPDENTSHKELNGESIHFPTADDFIEYLNGTLIPDLKEDGKIETAKDFEEAIFWLGKQ